MAKLSYDIERCQGVAYKEDGEFSWREGCEDCLRRTDKSYHQYKSYLIPPEIITFECEFRIPPK